jgi:hypothetical protein
LRAEAVACWLLRIQFHWVLSPAIICSPAIHHTQVLPLESVKTRRCDLQSPPWTRGLEEVNSNLQLLHRSPSPCLLLSSSSSSCRSSLWLPLRVIGPVGSLICYVCLDVQYFLVLSFQSTFITSILLYFLELNDSGYGQRRILATWEATWRSSFWRQISAGVTDRRQRD